MATRYRKGRKQTGKRTGKRRTGKRRTLRRGGDITDPFNLKIADTTKGLVNKFTGGG